MDQQEILQCLREYKERAKSRHGIRRIGLFGSHARSAAGRDSDIDIVVDIVHPDLFTLSHIKEELEELLGNQVDIVRQRGNMNPYLKKRLENTVIYV